MKWSNVPYIVGGIVSLWLSALMLFMMVELTRVAIEIILRSWV